MTLNEGASGPEGQLEDVGAPALSHGTPAGLDSVFIARGGIACAYLCHSIGGVQNQGQR